jgi:demethylmenaquinone methyltransferase/2-methoxy-6-polyprenyl-1,4-benzoquinol methylase
VTVWTEVEVALENIIDDYERVNHVISAFQDERSRLIGLNKIGPCQGNALELGSGPGNYSKLISNFNNGNLICLDYLAKMHKTARTRNKKLGHHYVRGIFEALPIRYSTMDFVTAAYALRDSLDKPKAIYEAYLTMRPDSKILIIDIGKPDNPLIRGFMSVFMRFIVPILGGLITGYGYPNPWSTLYLTFAKLPPNNKLVSLLQKRIMVIERIEKILGALLIIIGIKKEDTIRKQL